MLSDPYYAGWIVITDRSFEGRHEPIIDQALLDRVKTCCDARSRAANATACSSHYLKGMLYCERCFNLPEQRLSRLIYTEAKGRNGERYGYYLCRSRQAGQCDLPICRLIWSKKQSSRNYTRLQVPADFANAVRTQLEDAMADQTRMTSDLRASPTKQLVKLDAREERT